MGVGQKAACRCMDFGADVCSGLKAEAKLHLIRPGRVVGRTAMEGETKARSKS
jgi:hypothetical protein